MNVIQQYAMTRSFQLISQLSRNEITNESFSVRNIITNKII